MANINSSSAASASLPTEPSPSHAPKSAKNAQSTGQSANVKASKAILDEVGVNPLTVDATVSGLQTSVFSSLSMTANAVLGSEPLGISSEHISTALNNVANDLGGISNTLRAYCSNVRGTPEPDTSGGPSGTLLEEYRNPPTTYVNESSGGLTLTDIMDDLASLNNSQSNTLASEETANIDAINQQAASTTAQANDMLTGAHALLLCATTSFTLGMAAGAVGIVGMCAASSAADDVQMSSMVDDQAAMDHSAEQSSDLTQHALDTGNADDIDTAQKSIQNTQRDNTKLYAQGKITQEQHDSINTQMQQHSDALTARNPRDAVHAQHLATRTQSLRQNSITSISSLKKLGIRPGRRIMLDSTARRAAIKHVDGPPSNYHPDAAPGDRNLSITMYTDELKTQLRSMKPVSRNSQEWSQAYQNYDIPAQLLAGGLNTGAQYANNLGTVLNQQDQSYATKEEAAAQVASSANQAIQQGISNTESLAADLRQSQAAVAQDMSSMVSSTRV